MASRRILLVLIAIALGAMSLCSVFSLWIDRADTIRRQQAMIGDMAALLKTQVHRTIQNADLALQQGARVIDEIGGVGNTATPEARQRLRRVAEVLSQPGVLWVIDDKGLLVGGSAVPPESRLDVSDRAYFRALRDGQAEVDVGPAIRTRHGHILAFTVGRRLTAPDGAFAGVILVGIDIGVLTPFHDLLHFDGEPVLGVYRRDGAIIARRPIIEAMVGGSVAQDPLFRNALTTPEGRFAGVADLDHKDRIAAWRTVPDYGLIVHAAIEPGAVLAEWRKRAVVTGAVVISAAGLVVLAGLFGWIALGRQDRIREALHQTRVDREREAGERRLAEASAVAMREAAVTLLKAKEGAEAARALAEAANRDKDRFLAHISHELRTPLNAVIGFADMIAREAGTPMEAGNQARFAAHIRDSSQHLLSLINEILDHARARAGKLTLVEGEVDMEAAVAFAMTTIGPMAGYTGVALSWSVAGDRRLMRGDDRRIRQILLNLLSNAVKYTPSGGDVRVSIGPGSGGTLVLRVSDTGIGIGEGDMAEVMETFGRVDTAANRRTEGTGLGLPLTRHLVDLHGGTLSLTSAIGSGTTVTVSFPAWRVRADPRPAAPDTGPGAVVVAGRGPAPRPPPGRRPDGIGPGHGRCVLVVDDDPLVRDMAVALLAEEGFRVLAAANANEALSVLSGPERIDLLFTDIVLPPGMDGTALAHQARRLRPGIAVVLTSGFADDTAAGEDGPMRGHTLLAKPFDAAALGRTLAGILPAPVPTARILLADDIPINRELAVAVLATAGHQVRTVADGAAAVAAVRNGRFDLVLLDIHMPVMGGIAAARAIRVLPPPSGKVPILALTADDDATAEADWRAAGMDGVIHKPFDGDAFRAVVARFVAGARVEAVEAV